MAVTGVVVIALAACGGGSGGVGSTPAPPVGGSTPTPLPTPTPTPALPAPTPAPTPTPGPAGFAVEPAPAQFNTREFRLSDGSAQHNAASAWAQGATGDGVTIAIIDTGIDIDSPEFAGRISPNSIDIFGTRSLEGPDDHGTLVALAAAAARDNTGVLGIAWDSTILAIRGDEPGSCATGDNTVAGEGCAFLDTTIADSINHAVNNGAKVINLSLGGGGGTTPRVLNAVRGAVDAGAVIVVAAGNQQLDSLDGFASQLVTAGDGGVLIVGSVDKNYNASDFSNRPGAQSQSYLSARGQLVCCVYEDGELFLDDEGFIFLYSGTSFATPQVSGAAALLAQAFPNLTGREIAEILLESAFDAGETGEDAVFGRGILDIAAAFRPIGNTSIAGSSTVFTPGDITGTGSPAMGDALSTLSIPTLITDRYNRAFSTDLGGTLRGAAPRQLLHGALASTSRHLSGSTPRASLAFSIDNRGERAPLRLSFEEEKQAKVLAAQIALQLAPETKLAFGYATSGNGLVTSLRGADRPAFMIAGGASGANGLYNQTDAAVAMRHQLGTWGVNISAESGRIAGARDTQQFNTLRAISDAQRLTRMGLSLDRTLGEFELAAGFEWLAEGESVLGARFHEGLGLAGADSLFLDADIAWRPAGAWRLGVSWREGFTRPRAATLVANDARLRSRAWAVDVSRSGVLMSEDALALRLSQPLRVEGGALALLLPTAFNYTTLTPEYGRVPISLTPDGQEITGELAWRGPMLGGYAGASVFYRRDPGHYATLRDDAGLAIRWSRGF